MTPRSVAPEVRSARARKARAAYERQRQLEGWKPNAMQRQALDAAAEDLNLAWNNQLLAEALHLTPQAVLKWRRKPEFNAWWSAQITELARMRMAPGLARMACLIEDPETPMDEVRRSFEAMSKQIPMELRSEATASLWKVLEKFKGRRLRAAIEIDDGTGDGRHPHGPGEGEDPGMGKDGGFGGPKHVGPTAGRAGERAGDSETADRNPSSVGRVQVQLGNLEDALQAEGAVISAPPTLEHAARRALAESESAAVADDVQQGDDASAESTQHSESGSSGAGWSPGESDHLEGDQAAPGGGRVGMTNRPGSHEVPHAYDDSTCPSARDGAHLFSDTDADGVPSCSRCGLTDPDFEIQAEESAHPEPRDVSPSSRRGSSATSPVRGRCHADKKGEHNWHTDPEGRPVCSKCRVVMPTVGELLEAGIKLGRGVKKRKVVKAPRKTKSKGDYSKERLMKRVDPKEAES